MIAEYTSVRDNTHGISKNGLLRKQSSIVGAITIGNDVWIGRNTLILGNVNISEGVVVGANSFVNKHLDIKYGIYWGTPAQFKKERK
jgi:acetyltransferase-like isoleucine patch superfamily enzyme